MKKVIPIMILMVILIGTNIPAKAQMVWEEMEPIPTPRGLMTSCVLDGDIYVMGGINSPFGTPTAIVEVYDPQTNTWNTNIPDLPVPLLRASSGVINGKIYVTGGHHQNIWGGAVATVYEFDPADGGSWTTKASMLKPRFYHETEIVDNKMYVMGGRSEDAPGPIDNTIEMYDPITDTWTFKTSMQGARAAFSSEVIDGKIYVLGGSQFDTMYAEVEIYDPQTDTWSNGEDMPKGRTWHGSGMIGDSIFVFGGATEVNYIGFPLNETWKYHASSGWENIQLDIPEMKSAFAYASVFDGNNNQCLYAIGGATVEFWIPTTGPYVTDKNFKLCSDVTSIEKLEKNAVVLHQNYPNPFGYQTTIKYELKKSEQISIQIFNLTGEKVATIFEGFQSEGEHKIDLISEGIPNGVYFYQLQTEDVNYS